ncbi:hypothetical protein J7400_15635 [Shimia sp. R9_2]|uniref:hypothetical protein n=1 Tax=Shimia sp. R9_2 TaxID=2821112 RepID=UPI001ADA26E3|nr:hypothetical protein [Shimia sp. R9_2]MBO9398119.1 hypothetical protein [Shimia sp. R9_2]
MNIGNSQTILASTLIVFTIVCSPVPTLAYTMWDYLNFSQSHCSSTGGDWDGLACSGAGDMGIQRAIDAERERQAAAAWQKADAFENDFVSWLESFDPTEIFANESNPSISFEAYSNPELAKSYICLHGSLLFLAMADSRPDLFNRASRFFDNRSVAPRGFARLHLETAYFHLSLILRERYDPSFVLRIESEEQQKIVKAMIRNEVGNSLVGATFRLSKFKQTERGGNRHLDAFLRHFGFHTAGVDGYNSVFTSMNCRPNLRVYDYQSSRTTAFITNVFSDSIESFSIYDLMPPANTNELSYADDADMMIALLKSSKERKSLRLHQIPWQTPVMREFVERGISPKLKFVERHPHDHVPEYADLFEYGYPVGQTIFVDSLEGLPYQSDNTILRLIHGGFSISSHTIPIYISRFKTMRSEFDQALVREVERICKSRCS